MKKIVVTIFAICLSAFMVHAQETEKKTEGETNMENLFVKLKDGAKPHIYVDEKKFDFPLELIDQSKIASVFVIKDAKKLEKYNSPNGVVLITTKMKAESGGAKLKQEEDALPMVIIDGKLSEKAALETIAPENIESVNVVKGEQAIKKYNAPNGVIIIKTKK